MLFWPADPGSWTMTTREETDAMNAVPKPFLKDRPLSDNAADSYTMPARLYTDPDVFEQEKEEIFAKSGFAEHGVHQFHRLVMDALQV